jgi:hypothetical protein
MSSFPHDLRRAIHAVEDVRTPEATSPMPMKVVIPPKPSTLERKTLSREGFDGDEGGIRFTMPGDGQAQGKDAFRRESLDRVLGEPQKGLKGEKHKCKVGGST